MFEAKFEIPFNSEEEAKIILKSISKRGFKVISLYNTEIDLHSTKNIIFLEIRSKNTSSLRAACNSYLRWINTAYSINNVI